MTPKSAPQNDKPDDAEQSKRFEETARQLESDETGKTFNKALKATLPKVKRPPVKTGR